MIRKNLRLTLFAVSVFIANTASAQLFIDNAQFFIQTGATVTVQGDVTSNVDILGPGKLILKGTSNQNLSMGGSNIPNLEVDNTNNATLTSAAKISGDLLFTNGKLILSNSNLALGSSATITNATTSKYVVTSGTGKLIKASLGGTPFTYPVGNSITTYNPVTISNSGVADSIGVRCLANALSLGTTGTAFTKEVVDASWDVTESVAGGSNLSLTANWATSDQLTGFSTAKAGISYYVTSPAANVGWDLLNTGLTAAAAGTPNSSVTRSSITSLGTFAVGFRPVLSPLLVEPKVYLQGAYNTTNNNMNTSLATLGVIPTTEPYTGMTGYTHIGSGGGETVSSAAVFTSNNVVDWVFVSLHDAVTNAVVSTRSALLKNDGTILETDGTPLSMGGNLPGNYYFSVRHRNHIGVRTAASQNLSNAKVTKFSYNFASGLGQALAPVAPATNAAMTNKYGASITTPNYMLFAGDANPNKNVRYTGAGNDENALLNNAPLSGNKVTPSANGYYFSDFNLNGNVRYTGAANDENILLNISLLGNKVSPTFQATF